MNFLERHKTLMSRNQGIARPPPSPNLNTPPFYLEPIRTSQLILLYLKRINLQIQNQLRLNCGNRTSGCKDSRGARKKLNIYKKSSETPIILGIVQYFFSLIPIFQVCNCIQICFKKMLNPSSTIFDRKYFTDDFFHNFLK